MTSSCEADSEPGIDPAVPPPNPNRKLNYSQLKRAHANRVIPELKESDLEESFIRGRFPLQNNTLPSHYQDPRERSWWTID